MKREAWKMECDKEGEGRKEKEDGMRQEEREREEGMEEAGG